MAITVDHEPLPADNLGFLNMGELFGHLTGHGRLIVQIVIDGQSPDLRRMTELRGLPLTDHAIYIETADARQTALDVLTDAEAKLVEADALKSEAADLLQQNQQVPAMQKLSACIAIWQQTQQSVAGAAKLMNLDLANVSAAMGHLTAALEQIRSALLAGDFVLLADLLMYETDQITVQWKAAIAAVNLAIGESPLPATSV